LKVIKSEVVFVKIDNWFQVFEVIKAVQFELKGPTLHPIEAKRCKTQSIVYFLSPIASPNLYTWPNIRNHILFYLQFGDVEEEKNGG
jgi:hypothetical protein